MVNKEIVNEFMEMKKYTTPQIKLIELDNEISLALQSSPPAGPDELTTNLQNYPQADAFINNKFIS